MNFSPKVREQRLPFIGMCGLLAGLLAPAVGAAEAPKDAVDYNRDIRPIISSNCFACHGFDANTRQGGLRLDVPEGAFAAGKSGKKGIVPRTPDHSEVMARVMAKDGKRMPPGKELSAKEIDLLRRWIEQGAQFAPHWAFTAPKRPALPAVKNAKWGINPIDRFTLARMEKAGLKPSPTADRATLIRRLTFDLTGLPPTVAEINAFLSDTGPGAYERVVDRLLGSPRYGERMALEWLDLSRYADTHGYHIDSGRDMWPWRNWVIDAFNRNLSYDQFVIQQLAGDLLPNATLDQKIATGFNRNHPINFEGGAIPEEYHAAYVFDRVDTTATAFMGLTMKCAQCHDHKYDPLTQKDFYKFFAYFNNVPEQGLDGQAGNAAPFIKAPTPAQSSQLAEYAAKIAQLEKATAARVAETAPAQAEWEKTALSTLENSSLAAGLVGHYRFDETAGESVVNAAQGAGARVVGKAAWTGGKVGGALNLDGASHADLGAVTGFDRTDKFSYGGWVRPADKGAMTVVSRMDDAAGIRGWDLYIQDGKVFVHLIHQWDGNALRVNTTQPFEYNQWRHLFVTYDGSSKAAGVKIYVDGKPAAVEVTHDALTGTIVVPGAVHVGRRNPGAPFRGAIDEIRLYNRELSVADVA
ncbi:MAG TPA: DUF1549 domain-containing protein, partial [Armatimonadota bacterium]|nr:DUF1549 domain-containing protein [Armatimonadota bacterium]